MPRSPEDNQEIRSARCEAIIAAATRVFTAKGFTRAKVGEIAKEAGLSHGLVYHYFPSKDAVLAAIAHRMMAEIDREMDTPAERALDKLLAAMTRHHARLDGPVNEMRVMMQAVLEGTIPIDVKTDLRAHFRRIYDRLAGWIEEAQREGDIEADLPADELAGGLMSMFRGMSMRLPGLERLPFEPPTTRTITRMLCLTESGRARLDTLTAAPEKPARPTKRTAKPPADAKRPRGARKTPKHG
ncbi:MAG: TetR/AcrR family transcriptional regulator [Sandaracinaceae bacterium]|nr:TetR/AcrR family transcriptional regulator [Sandaracinaceae bacterium]